MGDELTEGAIEALLIDIRALAADSGQRVWLKPTKMLLGPPWVEYCQARGLDPVKTAQAIIDDEMKRDL